MKYVEVVINGKRRRLMAVRITYDELRHISYVQTNTPKVIWHDVKNSRAGTLSRFETLSLQEGMVIEVNEE